MRVICQALSSCQPTDRQTYRPTDRQTDLKTDSMTDRLTDSNQKTDRMTESTVKSTYFVPAVKYRGGEWWVVMGWGQEARLLSRIGNTTTQICPMYHSYPIVQTLRVTLSMTLRSGV